MFCVIMCHAIHQEDSHVFYVSVASRFQCNEQNIYIALVERAKKKCLRTGKSATDMITM